MKITTTKSALQSGLSFVSGIPAKSTMPILQNVLITNYGGVMSFVATNIEVQATASAPSECKELFAFTVSYNKLSTIVSRLSEDKITLDIDDGKVLVKSGRSKFNMQTLPADDFPKIQLQDKTGEVALDQAEFKKLLQSVSKAMATKDANRFFLNGALFEIKDNVLSVVGTDGGALSLNSTPVQSPNIEAIIPAATVMRLIKTLSTGQMTIEFYSQKIKIIIDGNEIIANLIDGKYPDYRRVIPNSYPHSVNVDRSRFIESCKRASVSTNEKYKVIALSFGKQMKFTGTNGGEESSDDFDIDYDGPDVEIGFNFEYLLNAADSILSDKLSIDFMDEARSIVMSDGDFKAVIMPTRKV